MSPVEQRRARLVLRHLLDGSGTSAEESARAVTALHATDPATVYLSVLARCRSLTLGDVSRELYDERRLVRIMARRRTLFVVPRDRGPLLHHAASLAVAETMRRALLKDLTGLPTEPVLPDDRAGWLAEVELATHEVVRRLGVASGAQVGAAEPRLRTALLPVTDKAYDVRRTITSSVLALMGAQGRIVRGRPLGSWTSRQHTWEPAESWWPDGLGEREPGQARADLVAAYLARFGPASERDVSWWTGWGLGVTRSALAACGAVEVPGGLVLPDDTGEVAVPAPVAALLPALDPTSMGWKQRDFYLPEDPRALFDAYGNIGPTVWWAGEVVGGWAVRPEGGIATRLLVDRGVEASVAVEQAAAALAPRLEGAVVVPAFRTPLERELSA